MQLQLNVCFKWSVTYVFSNRAFKISNHQGYALANTCLAPYICNCKQTRYKRSTLSVLPSIVFHQGRLYVCLALKYTLLYLRLSCGPRRTLFLKKKQTKKHLISAVDFAAHHLWLWWSSSFDNSEHNLSFVDQLCTWYHPNLISFDQYVLGLGYEYDPFGPIISIPPHLHGHYLTRTDTTASRQI